MTSPATSAIAEEQAHRDDRRARAGLSFGLAAMLWWGLSVFYFKAIADVPPPEILGHRVVWSMVLLGLLLAVRGAWRDGIAVLRDRRNLAVLGVTTVLIAVNWFTFIWAVTTDHVMQASLGYYINPLVNVVLAFVFLRERLRRAQWAAVLLAAAAVVLLTVSVGEVPVASLALAFSFGLYGLLRKTMRADGLVGLMVEITFLTPLAVGYLVWLHQRDALMFSSAGWQTAALLTMGGAVTALPLLWFANAARRLNYTTVGLLQYIAPSIQFVLAVFVFGEPFGGMQVVSYVLIWIALALYATDSLRASHQRKKPPRTATASPAPTPHTP